MYQMWRMCIRGIRHIRDIRYISGLFGSLSADKVSYGAGLFGCGSFGAFEAAEHPGDVAAECMHGLQAFAILPHFTRVAPICEVPVLRGHDGHVGDGEIFVAAVEGTVSSCTAGHGNRCTHLIGQH